MSTLLATPMSPGSTRESPAPDLGRPLRVLHVVNSLELGGTQNLLLRADRELRHRGVHSAVCVLSGAERTHEDYHELAPTYLDFTGDYRRPLAMWSCVRSLRDVLSREQPDILQSYLWTADFVSAMAVSRTSLAHVSQIVDRRDWMRSRRWVHALRRSATRHVFRRAQTRFLAVSEAARDFAVEHLEIPSSRTGVAYNGIDWSCYESLQPEPKNADQPFRLGTAGRLEPEKGHPHLIAAVKELLDEGQAIQLDITGEGTLRKKLEEQVASLGIGDHVRFLGWVSDVQAFYRRINAFLVPSVAAEGLPTTILEAMASGCVVIASDVGGAAEAIEHDSSGMLVPPEDVSGLKMAIKHIQGDSARSAAIGTAARQRVKSQFTTQRMVDTMVDTYLEELNLRSDR